MKSLRDALNLKSHEPARILIISIENTPNEADWLFNSIPVLNSIPNNAIIYRITLSESIADYTSFTAQFGYFQPTSLFVFGPHSTQISKCWISNYPNPEEFASYLAEIRIDSFQQSELIENNEKSAKKVIIYARGQKFSKNHTFYETDSVSVLHKWLDEEFGPGNNFKISTSSELLPKDSNLSLANLGIVHSAVLFQEFTRSKPNKIERINTSCNFSISRFLSKIYMLFQFCNPFSNFSDEDECFFNNIFEYHPSTNPDIAAVLSENILHGNL